jgi:small subunit ribosomal protein S16
MSLVIRLRRHGSRKKPFYRIVVAHSRSPRDGRFVAQVGTYDPAPDPTRVTLLKEEVERWIKAGAKPTETVRKLIKQASHTETGAETEVTA